MKPASAQLKQQYAVIFSSHRAPEDGPEYVAMAQHMEELASAQPGYLGIESARDPRGFGITVSYWDSLEAIQAWRQNVEHRAAQALGRERWYEEFSVKICRVERAYDFRPRPPA